MCGCFDKWQARIGRTFLVAVPASGSQRGWGIGRRTDDLMWSRAVGPFDEIEVVRVLSSHALE